MLRPSGNTLYKNHIEKNKDFIANDNANKKEWVKKKNKKKRR